MQFLGVLPSVEEVCILWSCNLGHNLISCSVTRNLGIGLTCLPNQHTDALLPFLIWNRKTHRANLPAKPTHWFVSNLYTHYSGHSLTVTTRPSKKARIFTQSQMHLVMLRWIRQRCIWLIWIRTNWTKRLRGFMISSWSCRAYGWCWAGRQMNRLGFS